MKTELNMWTLFHAGVEYESTWQIVLDQNSFVIGEIAGIAVNFAGNIVLLHSGSYRFQDTDFRYSEFLTTCFF